MQLCLYCDGEGENLDMATCTECDGSGIVDDDEEPEECYYCHGTGKDEMDEMGYCKPCNGTGVVL